jgi:peptidoglycan/xylan/chitin deacetylase (PgdA/CDA1 family)
MKKSAFTIICLLILFVQCTSPIKKSSDVTMNGKPLPRVLFITSGISDEAPALAQGVTIAIQSFNKYGAIVRLEPRNILYHFEELKKFNIVILSSFPGYHDADRKYSLSYMSDEELHNLTKFVSEGGVLISGENVGRNYPDGTDRIIIYKTLTPDNWELSKCYGVSLSEQNMTGFGLEGKISGYLQWDVPFDRLSNDEHELWTLVPLEVISKKTKTLGYWNDTMNSVISVIENQYEKGITYFLPLSGFLHPKNEGGYWSEDQIDSFYRYIIDNYNKTNGISFSLNPWPNGYDYAFCISLNAEGTMNQYERVFQLLSKENIQPTIFVNGRVNNEMRDYLKKKVAHLASSGFSYSNFDDLNYPQAVDDILRNENYWDIDFQGFRFPFTNSGYWGLMALNEHKYRYESSIGANNLDFFHGSVVPYNLVLSDNGFYKSTDMLEIAPTYHDDYYFLKRINEDNNPDLTEIGKNAMVYRKYLENYWNYAVKPYKGLMVFLGHPQYIGYSDTTLSALKYIVNEVKKENTWITTISEVADFRKNLSELQFYYDDHQNKQQIIIDGPENVILRDVCVNFTGKLKSAEAKNGKVRLVENATGTQIIFDAFKGQIITLQFK